MPQQSVPAHPLAAKARSHFSADLLKLASGTGSAQIIGVLAAPVVARLFSPDSFGLVALFASATSIIGVAVCLRYEVSILLPEKDEDAAKVVALCFCLVCVNTVLTLLIVSLAGEPLLRLTHLARLNKYIFLLPLNVFCTGITVILNGWNNRKRKFGRLSLVQLTSRICIVLLQLVLGFSGYRTGGVLIMSMVVGGYIYPSLVLCVLTCKDVFHLFVRAFSRSNISYAVKRYSRFPKYNSGSMILGSIAGQTPTVMLATAFSPQAAGQYSMGMRLLRMPMDLVGANFSRVFFPHAAEARHRGTLAHAVRSGLMYLIAVAMFPCLLLAFVGKDIFIIAFGQRWAEAGIYTQILGVWLFFWLIAIPMNKVFLVLEEQALELRFQALTLTTRLASLALGIVLHSARTGIILLALSGIAVYSAYTITILRKTGVNIRSIVRPLSSTFLTFVPAGAVIVCVKLLHCRSIIIAGVALLLTIIYYSNLVRTNQSARQVVTRLITRHQNY